MGKKAKILLVEDEEDVKDLMLVHLKSEGYETTWVESGEDALENLDKTGFNLVILDWMLPGISGLETCKKIGGRVPVLMVTARSSAADIVLGLEMGADDYITKPFEIPIFTARIRALLRRGQKSVSEQKHFEIGNLSIDVPSVKVFNGNKEISLTSYEFKLLVALLENQGKVLSREMLVKLIQGAGITVVGRTIDTHILSLRKKLGEVADFIETVRGIGYRIRV